MQPLHRVAEDSAFTSGSHAGYAIFRSPSVLELFPLTQPVKPSLTIGGVFSIRNLSWELARPADFYVLALSKTKVSLLHGNGSTIEAAKLPPGIPATLEEAMAFDPPDHDLENRSPSGNSTGAMHGVRFGTGAGREQKHAHLADYYRMVDRGLRDLVDQAQIPLILAGVDEDTNIYRSVCASHNVVKQSLPGGPDSLRDHSQVLRQSHFILRADAVECEAAAIKLAKERSTPARFLTDLDAILHAAFEGRVSDLYLAEGVEKTGVFENPGYRDWGSEDLLNLAAVQTIVHGGKSYEVPAAAMPAGTIAAALLRF
jgi:Bacterial archaeo-eukaryotic release factor family 3